MIKQWLKHIQFNMPMLILINILIVLAVGVIYTKHVSRTEFAELQQLERQRDLLNEEWGRLLLEQSTWGSPNLVQQKAQANFDMAVPTDKQTVVIQR
jgi:cell division protein FtsL